MQSDWEEIKLGDYCLKIGSGSTPRGGSQVYLDSGTYSLIRSQNILDNAFSHNGLVYIDEIAAKKLNNVTIEKNDVLINITGDSVARVCKAPKEYLPARVNQHVSIIRTDENELSSSFINYYLNSKKMQSYMLSLASTGATRNALTKSMIENFIILKPPLETQKKIANILSALDDKIELNRKMNQTLEEMAQALFKSWFMDFDPIHALQNSNGEDLETIASNVGISKEVLELFPSEFEESELGMIPKGWSVETLENTTDFQNGYSFKSKELHDDTNNSTKVFKMGHINRGGGFKEEGKDTYFYNVDDKDMSKYLLKKGDLLMAMTDMKANMALLAHTALMPYNDQYLLNQRVGRLRLRKDVAIGYSQLYIFTNHKDTIHDLRSRSNSGVQVNLTTKAILETKILLASDNLLKEFNTTVEKMFEKMFKNDSEIKTLEKTRDTLLPKLLSGELDVLRTED